MRYDATKDLKINYQINHALWLLEGSNKENMKPATEEEFDLEAHDNAVVKDFANKIKSHLSEVENSIVEQRNNSKAVANSQTIAGMQMCIEDFLGWLSDNASINPKELTDGQQTSDDLESHDKELLSKFIKYFDEKSDYDIIHNDEYGEYQPSRYSLKDIFENFLESQRVANSSIDEYEEK